MTPRAAVIIPALNEERLVRRAAASASLGYEPDDLEVVVVDGGSSDDTRVRAAEVARVMSAPTGRARQLNAGVRATSGPILVFLHADTVLPTGWLEAVESCLVRGDVAGGAFQPVFTRARGVLRLLNLPEPLRYPAWWFLMYGDQVQFTRRTTFDRVGGFPDIPLLEDLELARRLRREGRLIRLRRRAQTSSRRFAAHGSWRQQFANVRIVSAHLLGSSTPRELAARYHGRSGPAGKPASPGEEHRPPEPVGPERPEAEDRRERRA